MMQNSSSEGFSEYFVAYLVRDKQCVNSPLVTMWTCFGSDDPLFPAEIIDFLSGVERDRGLISPQIVLRNVVVLHSLSNQDAEDACLNQPEPQQPYWEWRRDQGLPYDQFDVLQSGSVIVERPSSTAELFVFGQMLAEFTLYSDRS